MPPDIVQTPYGIRRLILINSGMYGFAVFPIDRTLSICGENNSGKSTAVNALQFLFLTDMRDMDFGKHEAITTRKFYFPGPGSYVLAEVHLDHGYYVIGAAGSGPASQHHIHHFVYRGLFNETAFRGEDTDNILPLNDLLRKLQGDGIECFKLQPQELRNMLLGVPGDRRIDLTMAPLRGHRERYIRSWIEIFKNLLHMRNVNSQDLKRLLLDIFDIRLVAGDIDFAHEYQRVNAEVSRLADELHVLQRMQVHVERIVEQHEKRQALRNQLAAGYPAITNRLEEWYERYETDKTKARERLAAIEPERQQLKQAYDTDRQRLKRVVAEHRDVHTWIERIEREEAEFRLVSDVSDLDAELVRLTGEYERLVKSIGAGERVPAELAEREIADWEKQLERLDAMLANWDSNAWGRLSPHFQPEELRNVFALLNHEIVQLPVGSGNGVSVDDEAAVLATIRQLLACIEDGVYKADGVTIPLGNLTSIDVSELQDRGSVEARRERVADRIEALRADLSAAREIESLEARKAQVAKTGSAKRKFRDRFVEYLAERDKLDDKKEELELLTEKEQRLDSEMIAFAERQKELDQEVHDIRDAESARERERQLLESLQSRVQPLPPSEHAPEPDDAWFPDTLHELMDSYVYDWEDKRKADESIRHELDYVEVLGGGPYLREHEDDSIRSLAEAIRNIPQQQDLLDRARRTAVAELGNSLKGLLDNYERLENEVSAFNRAINKRTISNLTKLEIHLDPNDRVMEAIRELVKSRQWGFFADEQKASDAARFLYDWVSSQGRHLNLTHLFELSFVVFTQEGRQIVYRNLDRIESHGTTITIKALINMHMMGQLIDETRVGKVQIPYYLDEAASIDPNNQANLIEQGLSMGFVPVLASVKPQPTATYCVKIGTDDGPLVINEEAWVVLERKPEGNA